MFVANLLFSAYLFYVYFLRLVACPPFSSLWPCFAGAFDGFGLASQHGGRDPNRYPNANTNPNPNSNL